MKRLRLNDIIDSTFKSIQDLNNTKGKEYASEDECLANFYERGKALDLDPKIVWGVFFGKHMDAIYSYLKRGHTLSEPIHERINDAILYLILLRGLIEDDE